MKVAFSIAVFTTVIYVLAFPPSELPEGAFCFAVPMIIWAFSKPSFKLYFFTALASGWASWFVLLIWLRHVTWFGTFALSFIMACFFAAWFALAYWVMPTVKNKSFPLRLVLLGGLASAWVLFEWLRSFLFTGFPWLPLAVSQWERAPILQIASQTGAWGISFLLIFFNLAVAAFLKTSFVNKGVRRESFKLFGRITPELIIAVGSLLCMMLSYLEVLKGADDLEEMMTVGVVQPAVAATEKWDASIAQKHMRVLVDESFKINNKEPDIILWPETATPYAVIGSRGMKEWVHERVKVFGRPLIMGNMAAKDDIWHNGLFLVYPEEGLQEDYYIKRHLVPFGEYIPFNEYFPSLNKIVPLEGEFSEGNSADPMILNLPERSWKIGGLICFEDIFSELAIDTVKNGADLLCVVTNNSWFGEEGGAYQHAAHSVLRAVECRRPLIRCGNNGWSGWIDEFGFIRDVLKENDSIYFRGSGMLIVKRSKHWIGRESTYVKHGDWFVYLCASIFILMALLRFTILRDEK